MNVGVTTAITAGRSKDIATTQCGSPGEGNRGYDSALSHAVEEGRPSRWKDGLTRSFVHRSPIDDWKVGRSFWLKASLGQGSKDWAVVS